MTRAKTVYLLGADIGNTHTVLALWELSKHLPSEAPLKIWRIRTEKDLTSDELEIRVQSLFQLQGVHTSQIKTLIISSVVPSLSMTFSKISNRFNWEIQTVTYQSPLSFKISLNEPAEIGADRIVNAEAALRKFSPPLIIIDCGTATTFCVIDHSKNYLGGAIIPGFEISAQSLFQRASKLHSVEWVIPKTVIGGSTKEALQSGLTYASASLIDEFTRKIRKELSPSHPVTVILTGGVSHYFHEILTEIDYFEPDLTVFGLKEVYKNSLKKPGFQNHSKVNLNENLDLR